ncbi:hypothetical protein C8E97_1862 [Saccharothrix australiensis]|uniref:Uncharacterized protein n=1 Tax=Saccharothrix australiensis TaxID=2072 RepID=A0A495VXI5_9PSEU|nr:hypothetical protein C8E97_1862 [Saccharothrix australiensis]
MAGPSFRASADASGRAVGGSSLRASASVAVVGRPDCFRPPLDGLPLRGTAPPP